MNKLVNGTVAAVGTASDLECLELYASDPDGALAILYRRYSGMLHRIGQKYYSFSVQDIDSFVWTTIDKAVNSFKLKGGANFATYITLLMSNTMKNEYKRMKVVSVQRDWYMDIEWECNTRSEDDENFNVFNKQGIEEDWSRIDLLNSLPTLPLTPNQYAYIECIIRNGAPMSSAEIAREIGVTPAAVSAIKKSLSKKLENFF